MRAHVCARGCRKPLPRSYLREARKRVGPKKERIGPIIERLAIEHADAAIALRFRSPLELLVSVMLSAQTTDVNVNRVTERLFEKYRKPEDYLAVPQEELERDIFTTGFYRQKAKTVQAVCQALNQRLGTTGYLFNTTSHGKPDILSVCVRPRCKATRSLMHGV